MAFFHIFTCQYLDFTIVCYSDPANSDFSDDVQITCRRGSTRESVMEVEQTT